MKKLLFLTISLLLAVVAAFAQSPRPSKKYFEEKAYKIAKKTYDNEMESLDMLLADTIISDAYYRKSVKELHDNFNKYQTLIDGLAEHYAIFDYSELDSTDYQINFNIENGELEAADSIVRSRFNPKGVLQRNLTPAEKEKSAEYLYQLYTISLASFDNKRAEQYITTRAELDTMHWDWQSDAGLYLMKNNKLNKAEKYYERSYDVIYDILDEAEDSTAMVNTLTGRRIAYSLMGIAEFYKQTGNLEDANDLMKEAKRLYSKKEQEIIKTVVKVEVHDTIAGDTIVTDTIVSVTETVELETAPVLTAGEELEHAKELNSQGLACAASGQDDDCDTKFLEAIGIYERYLEGNPTEIEPLLAGVEYNLTMYYYDHSKITESLPLWVSVMKRYGKLAKTDAEAYGKRSNDINEFVKKLAPYADDHANDLLYKKNYAESEVYYINALEMYRWFAETEPDTYKAEVERIQNNLVVLANYLRKEGTEASLSQSVGIYKYLATFDAAKYNPRLAVALGSYSYSCLFNKHWEASEQAAREAIGMDSSLHWIYTNLAAALLLQGRYDEAEWIYLQFKGELKDSFLGDFNDLEAAGLIPAEREDDVEMIKDMLNQ